MAKQFLDASGLNQYTQALKNGTLIVGKAQVAQDSSKADYAKDASTAFYASHANAEGLIGIVPLANLPAGALEKLYIADNKAARLALTKAQVQNGDTVQEADTKKMFLVVDDTKLGTEDAEDAFVEYTAGRATVAQDASHADVATKALDSSRADLAYEANHASKADDASTAKEAAHAVKADDASTAKEAAHASKADDASTAKTAQEANHAKFADDASTAKTALNADHADTADDASTAKKAPWDGITGKPDVFMPDVDSSSLATYSKDASTGDINTADSLVTALAKLENKAEAGADERIPNDVIDSIVNGSYTPTA
jgi:hypothetical protein